MKNDEKSGNGTITYFNEDICGQWKNGLKDVNGVYIYANWSMYFKSSEMINKKVKEFIKV